MNPAEEIARIVAEYRALTQRSLVALEDLNARHAETERAMVEPEPVVAAAVEPDETDPDEDEYFRPTTWLV